MTGFRVVIWAVLVLSLIVNMVPTTTGEQEPNDSLDITNVVGEEWVTGHVDYDHDNETYIDVDYYKVELPANRISVLTLKNKEVKEFEEIGLHTYNEYKELDSLLDPYNDPIIYDYNNYIYTDEPGAEVRGMVKGGPLDSHFFIRISGRGNYSVKSHLITLPEVDDDPLYSPEIDIYVGKTTGMVYTLKYESIMIWDQDQYVFECNMSNFRFKIERTDQGSEPMSIWLQRNIRTEDMPEAILDPEMRVYSMVSLLDYNENKKLYNGSNYITHTPSTDYYLTLSGDGTYDITIEWFPLLEEKEGVEPDDDDTDDDTDDDIDDEGKDTEIEAFYVVGCMISSILVPFLFVVLIVLTMVLIFRKGKKEEKEKIEPAVKSSNTKDSPSKAPSPPEKKGKVKDPTIHISK